MKMRMKTMTFTRGSVLTGVDVDSLVHGAAAWECFTRQLSCGED